MDHVKTLRDGFSSPEKRGMKVLLLGVLFAMPIQTACAQGNGGPHGKGNSQQRFQGNQSVGNRSGGQRDSRNLGVVGSSLSPSQLDQLLRMREEEKLAYDVYVVLAQSSGLQIFKNISNAESKHMAAVEQLVSRNTTTSPLANLGVGKFSDAQLQRLYVDLVASGTTSPQAALVVGAKIEEMDIRDLELALAQNPPQEVARVLGNLQRASRNHLRAFSGELSRLGGTYIPEFLNQQTFDSIVSSGIERGPAGANGSIGSARPTSNNLRMGAPLQKGNGKMLGKR